MRRRERFINEVGIFGYWPGQRANGESFGVPCEFVTFIGAIRVKSTLFVRGTFAEYGEAVPVRT